MTLKAIFFGSIGTLTETSDMQRVAYNQAFEEAGLDWRWDSEAYRKMLSINGGMKRLRHYAAHTNTELSEAKMAELHRRKTEIFDDTMRRDGLPLRPGVHRLINEVRDAGLKLALVSATSRENLEAMADGVGAPFSLDLFDHVTDGSQLANGKPAPEVYELALSRLGLNAPDVVAIEDTQSSLQSAVDAGIATIATPGETTSDQDFSAAALVTESLDTIPVTLNTCRGLLKG